MHERRRVGEGDLNATGADSGDGASSLALLVLDDDANCLHASPDACRILGVSREDILAARLVDLLADGEGERFTHVWHAFRDHGGHAGPFQVEKNLARIDIRVTSEVLPARHLVVLSPIDDRTEGLGERQAELLSTPAEAGILSRPATGRRHERGPSERERQILAMVATGATDEEIARRLGLSPATVRTHVRNAKSKLGAQTRAQAVALAVGRRIIAAD